MRSSPRASPESVAIGTLLGLGVHLKIHGTELVTRVLNKVSILLRTYNTLVPTVSPFFCLSRQGTLAQQKRTCNPTQRTYDLTYHVP